MFVHVQKNIKKVKIFDKKLAILNKLYIQIIACIFLQNLIFFV